MSNQEQSFARVLVTVVNAIAAALWIGWLTDLGSATVEATRTDKAMTDVYPK
jgi:hypothetical protein